MGFSSLDNETLFASVKLLGEVFSLVKAYIQYLTETNLSCSILTVFSGLLSTGNSKKFTLISYRTMIYLNLPIFLSTYHLYSRGILVGIQRSSPLSFKGKGPDKALFTL